MNRHPVRWEAVIFGLVFVGVAGMWALWSLGWLTPDDLAYALAAVLIAVGLVGVVASLSRKEPHHDRINPAVEEVDPQP